MPGGTTVRLPGRWDLAFQALHKFFGGLAKYVTGLLRKDVNVRYVRASIHAIFNENASLLFLADRASREVVIMCVGLAVGRACVWRWCVGCCRATGDQNQ